MVSGSGSFDIRGSEYPALVHNKSPLTIGHLGTSTEVHIHLNVDAGDFVIIPAGIFYHLFLDEANCIEVWRLSKVSFFCLTVKFI